MRVSGSVLVVCLSVFMVLPAYAQQTGAANAIWSGVFTAEQASRGKTNFDLSCSRCHNLALIGSERGPAIKGQTFLSHWEKDTLAGLFTKIRDTMPEGNSGTVSEDVKVDILSYILQQNGFPAGTAELRKDPALLDQIRMSKKGIWDGVFTTAQADRGKAALLQNGCSGCHGAELEGGRGPSLKGARFTGAWENASLNKLLMKIRDTMPPLNAPQVSVNAKLDIVAYLLQVNGFPAGPTELALNEDALEGIAITKKGAESEGPPNFTLVRVVGCLTERPGGHWALTNATPPVPAREDATVETAAAGTESGTQTFQLISVRPAFEAKVHNGHRMEARGLIYREPERAELNLTSLQMVSAACGN